jgi:hypothetical protein
MFWCISDCTICRLTGFIRSHLYSFEVVLQIKNTQIYSASGHSMEVIVLHQMV